MASIVHFCVSTIFFAFLIEPPGSDQQALLAVWPRRSLKLQTDPRF
jgi:hypothetical protein